MSDILLSGSISTTGTAILGRSNVSFTSDADHTLSVPEYTNLYLNVTSSVSLTTTRNLIAPLVEGQAFIVSNNTTGGQEIQIVGISGLGVNISDGYTLHVVCDGSNYLPLTGGSGQTAIASAVGNVVFQPGGTAIGTTFTDFGLLLNYVNMQGFTYVNLYIDNTFIGSSGASVPAGHYILPNNVNFIGTEINGSPINFTDGVTFNVPNSITLTNSTLDIVNNSTANITVNNSDIFVNLIGSSSIIQTGTTPFVSVINGGTAFISIDDQSQLQANGVMFSCDSASFIQVFLASSQTTIFSGNEFVGATQSNVILIIGNPGFHINHNYLTNGTTINLQNGIIYLGSGNPNTTFPNGSAGNLFSSDNGNLWLFNTNASDGSSFWTPIDIVAKVIKNISSDSPIFFPSNSISTRNIADTTSGSITYTLVISTLEGETHKIGWFAGVNSCIVSGNLGSIIQDPNTGIIVGSYTYTHLGEYHDWVWSSAANAWLPF